MGILATLASLTPVSVPMAHWQQAQMERQADA